MPNENVSQPLTALKIVSRMVTVEVVIKDSKGRHITGLKPEDLQIFEETPSRSNEKRGQKIAAFEEIRVADLATANGSEPQIPPGVYTNVVLQQTPVPPTILLVDGLNTDVQYQSQVHVQMLRMLKSLPSNEPVAVFLLGNELQMLQDFTTDPKLLQEALNRSISPAGSGLARIDPRDDAHAPSAAIEKFAYLHDPTIDNMIELAKEFDQKVYASNMDIRVNRTVDALMSISRHVAGYPGRKNLLWLSTAFPIDLTPIGHNEDLNSVGNPKQVMDSDAGYRNYWAQLQRLNGALSDAKVAVYPVNVGGVESSDVYSASSIPRDLSIAGISDPLKREDTIRAARQDTMSALAEGTGGKVCTGDNDLGDCIRKAVDDSSDFYEIAYHPDSPYWSGEFRKVIVKTGRRDAHLAYRQGYFAKAQGGGEPKAQLSEMQSACKDYLNGTSIFLAAQMLPSSGDLKFHVMFNALALTFAETSTGEHEVNALVGVCTFNDQGEPQKLMNYTVSRTFDAEKYQILLHSGNLSETVSIPGPRPAAVRILVEDVATGRLGSVLVKLDDIHVRPPAINN